VYVMNADGTNVRRVTDIDSYKSDPDWSPDGLHLAFASGPAGPGPIFIINVDGSGFRQFTDSTASNPAWSPDGSSIAFICDPHDTGAFCIQNIEDGRIQLFVGKGPAWSPDGTRIVYVRGEAIYVMNQDGSQDTRLTGDLGSYPAPSWSPDGRFIAFIGGGWPTQLYVMNADGTEPRRITERPTGSYTPDWGPDSAQ